MKNIKVFFDVKEVDGQVILGVMGYLGNNTIKSEFRKIERLSLEESEGYNNYHSTIKALDLALKEIESYLTKEALQGVKVTLVNQNSLIFDWLVNKSYGFNYAGLYEEVEESLIAILPLVDFEYDIIRGKDNPVKKLLKNEVPTEKQTKKLDFSHLMGKVDKAQKTTESRNYGKVVGLNNSSSTVERFNL